MPLPTSCTQKKHYISVVHPRSRIRLFSISDPRSEIFHPGSRIHIKELSILTQKIVFKLSEIWSGLFIPDPDPNFLPIPDLGSRGQKNTGSRIRICNTASYTTWVSSEQVLWVRNAFLGYGSDFPDSFGSCMDMCESVSDSRALLGKFAHYSWIYG